MKTYKLNNVEISEKDLRQLIQDNPELLEKSNSVPFQDGDNYYVNNRGNVYRDTWCNDEIDYYRLDTGNAFKTKEEAEKKSLEMQSLARVNKYIRENDLRLTDVDWNNIEKYKWSIFYNIPSKKVGVSNWCSFNYKSLIDGLKSKEAGEQVIENCIDDLKVIFDVK